MKDGPVQITAHGEGWYDIPYMRADIANSQIAERDAKLKAIAAIVHRWIDSKDRNLDSGGGMLEILAILYPPPLPTGTKLEDNQP